MKKIFKILLTVIIIISFVKVYASTKTFERTEDNNYGIKKEIITTDTNIDNIKRTKLVDASEKIYDFSDILTPEEETELKKYIDEFINTTNMDMVILTDNVPYSMDRENDEYAVDFYDYNDFGIETKTFDGVILFRNTYEIDPYYGIYMTGEAQKYFTYERNENTLDNIFDYFVSKNYLSGMKLFISEFIDYYKSGIPEEYADSYLDESGELIIPRKYHPPFVAAAIAGLIVSSITVAIMVSKNKMVYKAKEANAYLNKETIKYNKKDSRLVSTNTVSHYNPPSSSSSSGSGHSFHGSSGIGHSGGGRHG